MDPRTLAAGRPAALRFDGEPGKSSDLLLSQLALSPSVISPGYAMVYR